MLDDDVLAFLRGTIKSVGALELLIYLRAHPDRAWSAGELERELRSSSMIVNDGLSSFQAAGLVRSDGPDRFRYEPVARELDELVHKISRLYAERRMTVINALFAQPNATLRNFADAFKFTRD